MSTLHDDHQLDSQLDSHLDSQIDFQLDSPEPHVNHHPDFDRWRPSAAPANPSPVEVSQSASELGSITTESLFDPPVSVDPPVLVQAVSVEVLATPTTAGNPTGDIGSSWQPQQVSPHVVSPQVDTWPPTTTWAPGGTAPETATSQFGTTTPAISANVDKKRSWLKPAFAGGLVGALLSGAVSAGTVLALREDNEDKATAPVTTIATAAVSNSIPQVAFADEPSNGVASATNTVKSAYETVKPAVVSINTKALNSEFGFGAQPSEGSGSGILISADGLVLTNAHVINGATSIKVTFADRQVRDAFLVGTSVERDVALIQVADVKGLPYAKLGESSRLQVGDPVVAIGNALALEGGPTVTSGIVSALDRDISDEEVTLESLIQTDAAINPGNSGGPLVNAAGEVVGMNTAIIQNSNNIGFSIAIDTIKPLIAELKANQGEAPKPRTFLGVTTMTVDSQMKAAYDLVVSVGAIVVDTQAGSPAENAGLVPGDIVVNFDGKAVTSSDELRSMVRARKPGDQVVVEWKRGPDTRKATIELGKSIIK
jgi:serine protease Do